MSIPPPPSLTRDIRSYNFRKRNTPDGTLDISSRTPTNLPGDGKMNIHTNNFYPYEETEYSESLSSNGKKKDPIDVRFTDEKSSSSSNEENDNIQEIEDLEESSSTAETLVRSDRTLDNYSIDEETDTIVLGKDEVNVNSRELENYLTSNNFVPKQTFILTNKNGINSYLVQIVSPYGSTFFIKFDEKIIVGKEKVFLTEYNGDYNLILFSTNFTKFLREKNIVTLMSEVLVYENTVYGDYNLFRETNNPYSYPVLSETLLEDPFKLAVESHIKCIDIDDFYKLELTELYNNMMNNIENLTKSVKEVFSVFNKLDNKNNEETDLLYEEFTKRLEKREFPTDSEIYRIRFLNDCISKYIQTQYILINKIKQNIYKSTEELNISSVNAYIQMKKDFPEDNFLPLDKRIDVKRSYPGKIFLKE